MYYHINRSINKDTKNKITVSHHTQEHTDVKYNTGVYVYVYHPVLNFAFSKCYQHCQDNHRGEEDTHTFVGVG